MKKITQTLTLGLILSFMFTTLGFAQQFEQAEATGKAENQPASMVFTGDRDEGEWLFYHDESHENALGLTAPGWFTSLAWWPADELDDYDGWAVTKGEVFQQDPTNADPIFSIWEGDDPEALTEVYFKEFDQVMTDWVELEFDDPHIIDASTGLWIGVAWDDLGEGNFPAGMDGTTAANGYSNMVALGNVPPEVPESLQDLAGIMGDFLLSIYVEEAGPMYEVTFAVTGEGDPLEGAWVELGEFEGETDEDGIIVFESVPEGTHEWSVSKEGWVTQSGDVEIDDDMTIDIDLEPAEAFEVTFIVTCETTENPIEGALVELGPFDGETDEDGMIVFEEVPEGIHEWSVSAEDYLTQSGDIEITEDTTVEIELEPGEEYTVTFEVENEYGDVIDDAVITLGDVTNEAGDYEFTVVPGEYDYLVEAEHHEDYEGSVDVESDITVEVIMVPDGTDIPQHETAFSVYPNPAKDVLNVETQNINQVRVFDLTGKVIYSQNVNANNVTIQVSEFGQGMYILQVETDKEVISERFNVVK